MMPILTMCAASPRLASHPRLKAGASIPPRLRAVRKKPLSFFEPLNYNQGSLAKQGKPRTNKSPHRDVVGLAMSLLRVDGLSGRRHAASTPTPRRQTSRSAEGRLRMDSRHRKHGPMIEAAGQRVKSDLTADRARTS